MTKIQFKPRKLLRARAFNFLIMLPLLTLSLSCSKSFENQERKEAWVPIYQSRDEIQKITNQQPKTPVNGGKIYAWKDYLFQLEPNEGIHVYSLVNKQATLLSFIQVYGAQEISIKNGVLYTNNLKDIISLDIQNVKQVQVLTRVKDAFTMENAFLLPPGRGFFQCYDENKGVIVGWELKKNIVASCKY